MNRRANGNRTIICMLIPHGNFLVGKSDVLDLPSTQVERCLLAEISKRMP